MMDAAAYRDQLAQLLPLGRAWPREPDTTLGGLLAGLAEEFARIDGRAADLIEEADPRTTVELLTDWERVAGLPDTCSGVPDTIRERQVAIANKIAELGGQSIPYFTAIAERLGYDVEIEELSSFDVDDRVDQDVNGDDWRHVWRVNIYLDSEQFRSTFSELTCDSTVEERLVGFGALNLECLIERAKPAHTIVLFAYIVEPAPLWWFDFLTETLITSGED